MYHNLEDAFDRALELNPDLMYDIFRMKRGLYLKFDKDKTIDENLAAIDESNMMVIDDKWNTLTRNDEELVEWFKKAAFYTTTLHTDGNNDTNKTVGGVKKISSVHYMACIMKIDQLPTFDEKLSKFMTNVYKNSVEPFTSNTAGKRFFPKLDKKAPSMEEYEKEVMRNFIGEDFEYVTSDARYEDYMKYVTKWELQYSKIAPYVTNHIVPNYPYLIDATSKSDLPSYICIYFDEPIEKLAIEQRAYRLSKLFAKNTFNEWTRDNNIVGVPSFRYVLNEKKPSFIYKSRKVNADYLCSIEEAEKVYNVYNWLKSVKYSDDALRGLVDDVYEHSKFVYDYTNDDVMNYVQINREMVDEKQLFVLRDVLGNGNFYNRDEKFTSRAVVMKYVEDYLFTTNVSILKHSESNGEYKSLHTKEKDAFNRIQDGFKMWVYEDKPLALRNSLLDALKLLVLNQVSTDKVKITAGVMVNSVDIRTLVNAYIWLVELFEVEGVSGLSETLIEMNKAVGKRVARGGSLESVEELLYVAGKFITRIHATSMKGEKDYTFIKKAYDFSDVEDVLNFVGSLVSKYAHNVTIGSELSEYVRAIMEFGLDNREEVITEREVLVLLAGAFSK